MQPAYHTTSGKPDWLFKWEIFFSFYSDIKRVQCLFLSAFVTVLALYSYLNVIAWLLMVFEIVLLNKTFFLSQMILIIWVHCTILYFYSRSVHKFTVWSVSLLMFSLFHFGVFKRINKSQYLPYFSLTFISYSL